MQNGKPHEAYQAERAGGQFKKGNPGRPRGIKEKHPRLTKSYLRKAMPMTGSEIIEQAAADQLYAIAKKLADDAANGDQQARQLLLKHVAPPTPKEVIRNCDHLADLPPEKRIIEVNAMLASGSISPQQAKALRDGAEMEINLLYLKPMKMLATQVSQGILSIEQFMNKFGEIQSLREKPIELENDENYSVEAADDKYDE